MKYTFTIERTTVETVEFTVELEGSDAWEEAEKIRDLALFDQRLLNVPKKHGGKKHGPWAAAGEIKRFGKPCSGCGGTGERTTYTCCYCNGSGVVKHTTEFSRE